MSISAILSIRKKVILLTLSLMIVFLASAPFASAAGTIQEYWKFKVTPSNPVYYSQSVNEGHFVLDVRTSFHLTGDQKAVFSFEKYSDQHKKWEPYQVTVLHAGQELQDDYSRSGVDIIEHPGTYRIALSFDGIDIKTGSLYVRY